MDRIRISENGRYFVYADGRPFPWLADTAWTIPQRMKWDDVIYYLQKRKSQGFTVLQIVALDPEQDEEMRNPAGERALLDQNLNQPNERYFSYLDWILDQAEEYGFYVLLLPVWGQLVVGSNWMGQVFEKTVTEENAYGYGKWIGERYKDRKNILWCLGGDRQPVHQGVDYRNVWRRLAEGLAYGSLGKVLHYNKPDPAWRELPLTYHACHEAGTGECSTMSYWTEEEAWISYIMLQSGHGLLPKNYDLVTKEYNRERVMPVWDGESAYEMMPTSWPVTEETQYHGTWMVRKRAYWGLFSGAFGHTYGHASMWSSISEKERSPYGKYTWYEALQSEGAKQMKYLREFMDGLQIMACRPLPEILPPDQEQEIMDMHLTACGDQKKRFFCVYFPSGGDAVLWTEQFWSREDFGQMQREVWLWWYDPRNGGFYKNEGDQEERGRQARIEEKGKMVVSAPSSGEEQDWILIVMREQTEPPIKTKTYFEINESVKEKKVFEW